MENDGLIEQLSDPELDLALRVTPYELSTTTQSPVCFVKFP
jgi:hypothetical protein